LTLSDYAIVAEIVVLIVAIELALRFAPFSRVQIWFAEGGAANPIPPRIQSCTTASRASRPPRIGLFHFLRPAYGKASCCARS
jgi:hypothetical protein